MKTSDREHDHGCDRFDDELASMLVSDPSEHELGCDDCKKARTAYGRITEALRELPAREPPVGWEDRVFARIDDVEEDAKLSGARRRTTLRIAEVTRVEATSAKGKTLPDLRDAKGNGLPDSPVLPERRVVTSLRRYGPVLALAAAIAGLGYYSYSSQTAPEGPIALNQRILKTSSGRRADSAVIGDSLQITATNGGCRFSELRVYRDENELVARCPGDEGCKDEGNRTTLTLPLPKKGSYRSLWAAGAHPIPRTSGKMDDDARAAHQAGARVDISPAEEVE